MKGNQEILTPQLDEDILEVKWINPQEFLKTHKIFASIRDLLKKVVMKKEL
jgi:hypothetical protein